VVDRDRLSVAPALYSRHHTLLSSLQFLGALQYLVSELRCNAKAEAKVKKVKKKRTATKKSVTGASHAQPPAVPGFGAAGGAGASSSGAQAVSVWPMVQCTSGKCSDPPVVDKWSRMRSKRVYVKRQTHMDEDDGDPHMHAPDDEFNWEHTCKSCLANELEISEKDAEVQIKEQGGPAAWARSRSMTFKAACEKAKEDPAHWGMSNNVIREIVRGDLVVLFEPLLPFITRKLKKMVQRNTGVEVYDELLKQYRKETDFDKQLKLMEQLEKIEDKIEENDKNLAFVGFVDPQQLEKIDNQTRALFVFELALCV
jgi:hypothetical protein